MEYGIGLVMPSTGGVFLGGPRPRGQCRSSTRTATWSPTCASKWPDAPRPGSAPCWCARSTCTPTRTAGAAASCTRPCPLVRRVTQIRDHAGRAQQRSGPASGRHLRQKWLGRPRLVVSRNPWGAPIPVWCPDDRPILRARTSTAPSRRLEADQIVERCGLPPSFIDSDAPEPGRPDGPSTMCSYLRRVRLPVRVRLRCLLSAGALPVGSEWFENHYRRLHR